MNVESYVAGEDFRALQDRRKSFAQSGGPTGQDAG
jgi:hypothetical protein